ncbi:IclR family transcriptional regulator [Paenarthrobacter sp. RAF54_2]|uniref:IclR family transcriptional regulator n=1 Tax=Paenarthrobacter sp. RAF54_2 TaxID=3233061 RepID=UPI003F9E8D44
MRQEISEYHKPTYSIGSIDNVLKTIHILRDFGSTRLSELAKILGVADSTAHRIMAMLTYHGFAVQDDHRRYWAGPAMYTPVISSEKVRAVQELAQPIIDTLVAEFRETVSLCTRIGEHSRVLLSVAPEFSDHVPERTGNVMMAHVSAAGRALLALLPQEQVERLYQSKAAESRGSILSERDYAILLSELEATRKRGYSRCVDAINSGISAIGVPVAPPNTPPVAIVISTPTPRLPALYRDPGRLRLLFHARDELTAALRSDSVLAEDSVEFIA